MEAATRIKHGPLARTGPVIVGLDGSDSAIDAVVLGRRLAEALGRSAVLTHVRPLHSFDGFNQLVAERLATATDRTQVLPARSVTAGLTAFARKEDASAIVVGVGTTGARLLKRSCVPVAVAPAGYAQSEAGVAEIGVGFDGSEDSRAALAWAAAAARGEGSRLRIIGVHEPVPIDRLALTGGLASPAFSTVVREQQEKRLAIGAAEFGEGLAVEPELRDGTISDVLVDASENLDLLVVGTRGLGRVRGAVLGSVSAAVIQAAQSPVVVVPSATR
jgi:nucleotide-binding universal stress UspA family protein